MKMVVLFRRRHTAMPRQGVATLWVTTKNAPFSDRNKVFQAFLKTFEIASNNNDVKICFDWFQCRFLY